MAFRGVVMIGNPKLRGGGVGGSGISRGDKQVMRSLKMLILWTFLVCQC